MLEPTTDLLTVPPDKTLPHPYRVNEIKNSQSREGQFSPISNDITYLNNEFTKEENIDEITRKSVVVEVDQKLETELNEDPEEEKKETMKNKQNFFADPTKAIVLHNILMKDDAAVTAYEIPEEWERQFHHPYNEDGFGHKQNHHEKMDAMKKILDEKEEAANLMKEKDLEEKLRIEKEKEENYKRDKEIEERKVIEKEEAVNLEKEMKEKELEEKLRIEREKEENDKRDKEIEERKAIEKEEAIKQYIALISSGEGEITEEKLAEYQKMTLEEIEELSKIEKEREVKKETKTELIKTEKDDVIELNNVEEGLNNELEDEEVKNVNNPIPKSEVNIEHNKESSLVEENKLHIEKEEEENKILAPKPPTHQSLSVYIPKKDYEIPNEWVMDENSFEQGVEKDYGKSKKLEPSSAQKFTSVFPCLATERSIQQTPGSAMFNESKRWMESGLLNKYDESLDDQELIKFKDNNWEEESNILRGSIMSIIGAPKKRVSGLGPKVRGKGGHKNHNHKLNMNKLNSGVFEGLDTPSPIRPKEEMGEKLPQIGKKTTFFGEPPKATESSYASDYQNNQSSIVVDKEEETPPINNKKEIAFNPAPLQEVSDESFLI